MQVNLRFRLIAAPGTCAVAKQEIDQIARFVSRFVQAEIGDSHRRLVDRMQNRKALLSAFAVCKVRIVFVDRHLETLVTQYNSRRRTGNSNFHATTGPDTVCRLLERSPAADALLFQSVAGIDRFVLTAEAAETCAIHL